MITWLWRPIRSVLSSLLSESFPVKVEAPYPDTPADYATVYARLPSDDSLITEVCVRAERLYQEADERRATIEQKATSLLMAISLAAALLSAASGILIVDRDKLATSEMVPIGIVLVATLLAFLYSAYKAVRSLMVTQWAGPGPLIVYDLDEEGVSVVEFKHRWTAHLMVARRFNDSAVSLKGGWLGEAQSWFVVGILGLMLTALTVAIVSVVSDSKDTSKAEAMVSTFAALVLDQV